MLKTIQLICFILLWVCTPNNASGKSTSDVIHCVLHETEQQNYLVLHELIFHATSKTYEQGNFRSVGYNETRISVYNADNGKLIVQKNLGAIADDNNWVLLGCSNDKILLFTTHERKGFLSLNINTLDINTTFVNYMINRDYSKVFLMSDWQSMYRNYGHNPFASALVFTDTLNHKYSCNIENYEVRKVKYRLKPRRRSDYFETSFYLNDIKYSFTRGSLPCILIDDEISKHCFYDGQFIMEQDPIRQFNYLIDLKSSLDDLRNEKYQKSEALKFAKNDHYKVLEHEVDSIDQLATDNNTRISNLLKGYQSSEILLQPNSKSVFIAHRNSIKPDAILSISKIEVEQKNILFNPWSTVIPGMFYNVSEAANTTAFLRYFSQEVPESQFISFQLLDDKLIIIYLLQICCLDTQTGEILWRIRL